MMTQLAIIAGLLAGIRCTLVDIKKIIKSNEDESHE